MAIGVTLPMTNGSSYLIHCARGWTARQCRLLRDSGGEASCSWKALERRQAWSLSQLRSGYRWLDRVKSRRYRRDGRNTGGASESWTRSENQGRWAQWRVTRVSPVPVDARSLAKIRGWQPPEGTRKPEGCPRSGETRPCLLTTDPGKGRSKSNHDEWPRWQRKHWNRPQSSQKQKDGHM